MPTDDGRRARPIGGLSSTDDGTHWLSSDSSRPEPSGDDRRRRTERPSSTVRVAVRGFGPGRTASLFVSLDDGTTWTEESVPLDTDGGGVHLTSGGVVRRRRPPYPHGRRQRASGASGCSLCRRRSLVSGGSGRSRQSSDSPPSPDGERSTRRENIDGLFVGERVTGAFRSNASVVPEATAVPSTFMSSVWTRGSELWACAARRADSSLGFRSRRNDV